MGNVFGFYKTKHILLSDSAIHVIDDIYKVINAFIRSIKHFFTALFNDDWFLWQFRANSQDTPLSWVTIFGFTFCCLCAGY